MKEFIIVQHEWHVHSRGFTVSRVFAKDENDAYDKGVLLTHKATNHFSRAFTVIELDDTEFMPTKLTLRQRLTGRY